MKKLSSFIAGMLTMVLITATGLTAFAANITTLKNVMVGGVSIVVDGIKINPTDSNGKKVDPIVYNGTTYLPVRAVGAALGKEVYWDSSSSTVYLGSRAGTASGNVSVMLRDLKTISGKYGDNYSSSLDLLGKVKINKETDNYGNYYSSFTDDGYDGENKLEYLINNNYSRLKGTLYIPEGENRDGSGYITVIADGKKKYTSPRMVKQSSPIELDVDVTGCNDVIIQFNVKSCSLCLGDASFYR